MTLPPFHAFSTFAGVAGSLPAVTLGLPQTSAWTQWKSSSSPKSGGILSIPRWMGHLGRFSPRSCRGTLFPLFALFSFSFSPFGTERVLAVQHPALIHAWLTAFIMSLIRTQPLEELLGFRVLCCRAPEGTGTGAGEGRGRL